MYSYTNNRKCLHCATPIADQAHASRKFCHREKLDDGTIKCCKDDFHSAKNKDTEDRLRSLALFHKKMHQRIEALVKANGYTVEHEQINRYRINLFRPVQFEFIDGMYKGWFLEYMIERTGEKKYKISKHGLLF